MNAANDFETKTFWIYFGLLLFRLFSQNWCCMSSILNSKFFRYCNNWDSF